MCICYDHAPPLCLLLPHTYSLRCLPGLLSIIWYATGCTAIGSGTDRSRLLPIGPLCFPTMIKLLHTAAGVPLGTPVSWLSACPLGCMSICVVLVCILQMCRRHSRSSAGKCMLGQHFRSVHGGCSFVMLLLLSVGCLHMAAIVKADYHTYIPC